MIKIPSSWIYVSWQELKTKNGVLNYIGSVESEPYVYPFKVDEPLIYYTLLVKTYSTSAGEDCNDFYENYKDDIDNSNVSLSRRSDDGLLTVYSSPRPANTSVYWTGAADSTLTEDCSGIGNGEDLYFSLSSSDSYVETDLEFHHDVYLQDGFFISKDAPFGAMLDVSVVHPLYGVVAVFINKIPIFGSERVSLSTSDRAIIQKGLKIRVRVSNSDPETYEKHDERCNFKALGALKLFRAITC